MTQYQQVIWDWNGTILDDSQVAFSCICQLLAAENKPLIDFDYFRRNVKFPLDRFYVEIGLFDDQSDFLVWEDKFHLLYDQQVLLHSKLHPVVDQIIKDLHQASVSQVILSARDHKSLQRDVAHFQLTNYFQIIQGSQPKLSYKGKLDYAKDILLANEGPKLLIGDTLHDYEIAEALGIDCLLVAQGINHYDLLKTSGARVLSKHSEILNFL